MWESTWPYILQKHGYYVGHIGKWQFHDTGFVKNAFNWTRLFEGQHWHKIRGKWIHTTDHTENSTIDFLRERPTDRPFALTVAFYPPKGINSKTLRWFNPKPESMHLYANVTIPEAFDHNTSWARLNPTVFTEHNIGRETWFWSFGTPEVHQRNMKDMYRLITEVDEACKNIVNELKMQGIENETMVIFTSDNGFLHGEHGLGGKWVPYKESIRVPLIIWDPRMPESKRGSLDTSFTLNIDLAPTILGAAKIDPHPSMQGRDISDLYLDPDQSAKWRTEFYYEHPTHQGERKIPKSSALVRKDFKYMRYDNYKVETLFHLESDPMELNDVINHPVFSKKLVEMKERYEELKKEVAEPYNSTV
jgi:arylsulfatase